MNDSIEFHKDFDTGKVQGITFGRLPVGLSDGTIRMFLMPDGLHFIIPKSAKDKFVHFYDDGDGEFCGWFKAI